MRLDSSQKPSIWANVSWEQGIPDSAMRFSTKRKRRSNFALVRPSAIAGSICKCRAVFTKLNKRSPNSASASSCVPCASASVNSASSSSIFFCGPSAVSQSKPFFAARFCSLYARVSGGKVFGMESSAEALARPSTVSLMVSHCARRSSSRRKKLPPAQTYTQS